MFDKLASGIAWKVSAFGVILVRISRIRTFQNYMMLRSTGNNILQNW